MSSETDLNKLYGALVEAAVDGIISINHQGIVQSFNHAAELLFGFSRHDVIGKNITLLMPAQQAAEHDQYIQTYLNEGKARIIGIGRDVVGVRKDGTSFPMHLSVGEAETEQGHMFIGVCHDLTAHRKLLLQLARAEKRFKDIVQNQKELICRLDVESRLSFLNNSAIRHLKQDESILIGSLFAELVTEDQRAYVAHCLWNLRAKGDPNNELVLVVDMQLPNEIASIEWHFKVMPNTEEFGEEIQGFGMDVTEREAALKRAQYLQDHDQLTGLFNRHAMQSAFTTWQRDRTLFSVLYIDCNHFGLINQKYGHETGDQLLIAIGQRLHRHLPVDCLLARLSGDDFVVVVPAQSMTDTASLASGLIRELEQPFELKSITLDIRVRVGIAHAPDDSEELEELIRMAESAIMTRNNSDLPVRFYNPNQQAKMTRFLDIEERLRLALQEDKIDIHLQPKVALRNDQVVGYEALARWQEGEFVISPAEFIPVAEACGLGRDFDRYVIKKVFAALARSKTPLPPVAINITAQHFGHPNLFEFIHEALQEFELPASAIVLEITEGVLVDRVPTTLENITNLRALGIKIHIDDFGTGYSSLGYLMDLPIDVIKIDKIFVDRLEEERGRHLVEGIIAMAKAMDFEVIAEGIETAIQKDLLKAMGCCVGQGYFHGKPQPMLSIVA